MFIFTSKNLPEALDAEKSIPCSFVFKKNAPAKLTPLTSIPDRSSPIIGVFVLIKNAKAFLAARVIELSSFESSSTCMSCV